MCAQRSDREDRGEERDTDARRVRGSGFSPTPFLQLGRMLSD